MVDLAKSLAEKNDTWLISWHWPPANTHVLSPSPKSNAFSPFTNTSTMRDMLGRRGMFVNVRSAFQLPTIFAPNMAPNSMSVRRDNPRHITVLPGQDRWPERDRPVESCDLDQVLRQGLSTYWAFIVHEVIK
jgi:hypothetical protein